MHIITGDLPRSNWFLINPSHSPPLSKYLFAGENWFVRVSLRAASSGGIPSLIGLEQLST